MDLLPSLGDASGYLKKLGKGRCILLVTTIYPKAAAIEPTEPIENESPVTESATLSGLTPVYPDQAKLNPLNLLNDPPQESLNPLLPPAITLTQPPDGNLTNPLIELQIPEGEFDPENNGLTELTETPKEEHFFFNIRAKVSFDDNIFLTENNTESDTLLRVRARGNWESGRRGRSIHWLSAYAEPSYVKFLENGDLDNFDYKLGTVYEFEKGDTTINASLSFDSNSDVDRFTSQRFEKNQTTLLVRGNHRWSDKTILDGQLRFSHTANDQFSDTTSYGGRISTLYHASDKTKIGPFFGIKRSESENNPAFTSFVGGAHLKYDFTDKINLEAFAGLEYRDFESGRSSTLDPSFSFRAKYEASDKFSHELTLAHRSYSSFNINSAGYRATTLDYRARYKPSSKIRINGNLGYEYDDYFETGLEDANLPTISYFYAGAGLSYDWTNQHTVSLNYRYRHSNSTEANRDFSNHLIELNFGYQF